MHCAYLAAAFHRPAWQMSSGVAAWVTLAHTTTIRPLTTAHHPVRVRRDRLHDADSEPVFGMVELIDRFARAHARRLLPLKNLFDLRMPDRVHTWVVIEKPLNHIGERLRRDHALRVAREVSRVIRAGPTTGPMKRWPGS